MVRVRGFSDTPSIRRNEAQTCCSAFIEKQPRLYFVYHEQDRIAVWPRWAFGDADDLGNRAVAVGLSTGSRKKKDSTWAHNYPLNIYVHTEKELTRLLPIIAAAERAISERSGPEVVVPDTLIRQARRSTPPAISFRYID